jgi:hypothetical protein
LSKTSSAARTLVGDHYGGEWPRSQFKKHGASYKPADQTKSDLYLHLLPLLNRAASNCSIIRA